MAFASTINLTIITMMIIIYLNEMRNISMFIFNFNYIKDLARITMDEKCNGIYCEAETDRYQIAKNSYNLLMPNDVFNSKTYTIFVFIISIMIFIYYYRMMVDFKDNPFTSIIITLFFFIILIIMIAVRYVPNDEQGYKNYYKKNSTGTNTQHAVSSILSSIVFIIVLLVYQVLSTKGKMVVPELSYRYNEWDLNWLINAVRVLNDKGVLLIEFIKLTCFFISITLVFNLMNIVMCFRTNTTPILKTKPLTYSLSNSLNNHVNYRCTPKIIDVDEKTLSGCQKIKTEYSKVVKFQNEPTNKKNIVNYITDKQKVDISIVKDDEIIFDKNTKVLKKDANLDNIIITPGVFNEKRHMFKDISSGLDIYIAFEELSKIIFYSWDEGSYKYNEKKSIKDDVYIQKLKNTINMSDVSITNDPAYSSTLSLIFDEKVSIPKDYNYSSNEHILNSNDCNTSYEYTADISYGNANVFYEKYWDMKNINDPDGNFLDRYFYFVPNNLNIFKGANLYGFMVDVLYFIIIVFFSLFIYAFLWWMYFHNLNYIYIFSENLIEILFPLIAFVVFVTYIIVFIRFNTNFNKNVVYKCLDCSYKRSLNKLNNIVSPYIRMYDDKIIGGNKDYKHHYIIANVFYSILSGNINLSANTFSPINENVDETSYLKSKELKEVDINSINNLNNENQFREYYKARFKNLYNTKYDDTEVKKIYEVFKNLFGDTAAKNTQEDINSYFITNIIKYELILKIYRIIKICIKLFDEKTFNNSDIDNYNDFRFYKKSSKLIPHKFILILRSEEAFTNFVNKHDVDTYINEFNASFAKDAKDKINIGLIEPTDHAKHANNKDVNMTMILEDIDNEDSTNQKPDIQNKNMIKIIAKYLLIMGHMNYNGFKYREKGKTEANNKDKKDIYTLQTLNLYELISNVSYVDTFDIDDTFGITKITNNKYKTLTYMYNYLDTKYVILSSNNNKNYLLNIIKSINNTLNNDNKTTQPDNFKDIKDAQYLFRSKINDIAPLPYENEDEILNNAHYISTTSFESTYFVNMFIIISYIIGTIVFKIK